MNKNSSIITVLKCVWPILLSILLMVCTVEPLTYESRSGYGSGHTSISTNKSSYGLGLYDEIPAVNYYFIMLVVVAIVAIILISCCCVLNGNNKLMLSALIVQALILPVSVFLLLGFDYINDYASAGDLYAYDRSSVYINFWGFVIFFILPLIGIFRTNKVIANTYFGGDLWCKETSRTE